MDFRGTGIPEDPKLERAIWDAVTPALTEIQSSYDTKRSYAEAKASVVRGMEMYGKLAEDPPVWAMKHFTAVRFHMYYSAMVGLCQFRKRIVLAHSMDSPERKAEDAWFFGEMRALYPKAKALARTNREETELYRIMTEVGVTP